MPSAYVHVPFCRHRCGYCNFTVVAGRDDLIGSYLDALQRELSWLRTPRPVETLFVGGGTPTQLPAPDLERLLTIVTDWFILPTDGEFSVEANPADVDSTKLRLLSEAGVNRISLGAQSFNAAKLQLLERDHAASDICRAVELARPCMRSISLDLIFAVPGETPAVWQDELDQTLSLEVHHVSTYGLTYERGARFWSQRAKGHLRAVTEEDERQMYETAIETLGRCGWEHYEVSNFARSGHRCRHNDVYWVGGEYYAAGPGASRHLNDCRETNHRSTATYLRRVLAGQSPVVERECLGPEDRARERLVFGLRRLEGIDPTVFQQQTGFSLTQLLGPRLDHLLAQGLLMFAGQRLQLTRQGLLVSDSMWPQMLRV
jgi:oxygen-independent coproporphyrinogen-3 oxidase